jgi:hypothetical protein
MVPTIYLFLPAVLGPEAYSMSKRKSFWGIERGWHIQLTTNLHVSRLSRHCWILKTISLHGLLWGELYFLNFEKAIFTTFTFASFKFVRPIFRLTWRILGSFKTYVYSIAVRASTRYFEVLHFSLATLLRKYRFTNNTKLKSLIQLQYYII